MTSPQDPWQQNPQSGSGPSSTPSGYPQQPQGGQYPQYPQQQYPQQYPQPGYQQYGQPGYQPNPYAAPPVNDSGASGPPRPLPLTIAFWIAIIVPIVATALVAVTFVVAQSWMNDVINANLNSSGVDSNSEEARAASSFGNGFMMVIFGIILIVLLGLTTLWIVFAYKMRAGRNWARVTLTVFAALWLLMSLGNLAGGQGSPVNVASTQQVPAGMEVPASITALGYAQGGVAVVGMAAFIVLVYLRQSNWFFQASNYRS